MTSLITLLSTICLSVRRRRSLSWLLLLSKILPRITKLLRKMPFRFLSMRKLTRPMVLLLYPWRTRSMPVLVQVSSMVTSWPRKTSFQRVCYLNLRRLWKLVKSLRCLKLPSLLISELLFLTQRMSTICSLSRASTFKLRLSTEHLSSLVDRIMTTLVSSMENSFPINLQLGVLRVLTWLSLWLTKFSSLVVKRWHLSLLCLNLRFIAP